MAIDREVEPSGNREVETIVAAFAGFREVESTSIGRGGLVGVGELCGDHSIEYDRISSNDRGREVGVASPPGMAHTMLSH